MNQTTHLLASPRSKRTNRYLWLLLLPASLVVGSLVLAFVLIFQPFAKPVDYTVNKLFYLEHHGKAIHIDLLKATLYLESEHLFCDNGNCRYSNHYDCKASIDYITVEDLFIPFIVDPSLPGYEDKVKGQVFIRVEGSVNRRWWLNVDGIPIQYRDIDKKIVKFTNVRPANHSEFNIDDYCEGRHQKSKFVLKSKRKTRFLQLT
ncbi:hypothetical protein GEMRC1_002615 [Eukaryota sp. GEM-RC1]